MVVTQKHGVNIANLDTLNKHNPPIGIRQFSIECFLPVYVREKLRHELKGCGAMDFTFEAKGIIVNSMQIIYDSKY